MDSMEPKPQNNTLGIIGLITGIFSIVLAFCCNVVGVITGIVAIICGVLANKEKQNYAIAGIVLGIIGLILSIAMIFVSISLLPYWQDLIYELY